MAGSGLFRELRRRHIWRVAIAYAVTAWLLLQLAAIVLPTFGAPHWVLKVLIGVFVLFFPIALIVAWAFEVTPEGVRRTPSADSEAARPAQTHRRVGRTLNVITLVVLAAAVGVLAWQLTAARSHSASVAASSATPASAAPASVATKIPAKSIAVLPFENLSPDKNNAYFAAGMQDLILTKLADIGDLKVISRTSTARFSSHPDDLETIARELGVATILEGSVQKAGKQVLINVQLIDARTDGHIWARAYTRTLSNIFGVEGEVAGKIADALKAKLTAPEQRRLAAAPTTNTAAYEAYLSGRAAETSTGTGDAVYPKAARAYQKAVALDPHFGLAWAGLALAEAVSYGQHLGDRRKDLSAARKALHQALTLAPDAAATQLALAELRDHVQNDYKGALKAARRALAREPGNWEAISEVTYLDAALGRWQEAVATARKAVALDPLNPRTLLTAADRFLNVNDFAAALRMADRVLALDPGNRSAIADNAAIYQNQGRFAAAHKLLAGRDVSAPDAPTSNPLFGAVLEQRWLDRDYAGVIRLLRPLVSPSSSLPADWKLLYVGTLGWAEKLAGLDQEARKTFEQGRTELRERIRQVKPGDSDTLVVLYGNLGVAEAGLGHRAAALAADRKAVALMPASKNALGAAYSELNLAEIEARVGEHAAAISHIRHLLNTPPYAVTPALLRADPWWDPLRKDPAFQSLLKQNPPTAASTVKAATPTP